MMQTERIASIAATRFIGSGTGMQASEDTQPMTDPLDFHTQDVYRTPIYAYSNIKTDTARGALDEIERSSIEVRFDGIDSEIRYLWIFSAVNAAIIFLWILGCACNKGPTP